MKTLRYSLLTAWIVFLVVIIGCVTSPAYKSLYTAGHATDAAVKSYFDLVVAGKVRTNGVPTVAKAYTEFQAVYAVALKAAQGNINAPPDATVIAQESEVFSVLEKAKALK